MAVVAAAMVVVGIAVALIDPRRGNGNDRADDGHVDRPDALPSLSGALIGRDDELTRLLGVLAPSRKRFRRMRGYASREEPGRARIVVIHGAPGIGKTHLALHAAHRTRHSFPGGTLYVNLGTQNDAPLSAAEGLAQLLHQLGMDRSIPADPDERAAMFRSRVADREVLIVLDNAVDSTQILPLLPADASCGVVVTCHRAQPSVPATLSVKLERVTTDIGIAILSEHSRLDRAMVETSAGRELVRLCDCVPLAITVIARKLAARPYLDIEQVVRELADERSRLQALSYDGLGVAASIRVVHQDLSDEARTLLCYLGLGAFPEVSVWHASEILGASPAHAEPVLHQLVDVALVEITEANFPFRRYRVHDLVRAFASEQLEVTEAPARRVEIAHRLVHAYATRARRAATPRVPEWCDGARDSSWTGAAWFIAERENLSAAVQLAGQSQMEGETVQIVAAMSFFHDDLAAFPSEFQPLFRSALQAAENIADPLDQAILRCGLGELFLREERYTAAESELTAALALLDVEEPTHIPSVARARRLLGLGYREQGDYARARELLTASLRMFESQNDIWGRAQASRSLGKVYRAEADWRRALSMQRNAVADFESLGDQWQKARALDTMALTYLWHARQLDNADEASREAIQIFRNLGDELWLAHALYTRGHVLRLMGQPKESHTAYTEGLTTFQRYGVRIWAARMLNARSRASVLLNNPHSAREDVNTALSVFQSLGHDVWWANTARMAAWLDCAQGDPQRAIERIEAAQRISTEHGDLSAARDARYWSGVFHREAGLLSRSRELLEEVLEEYRQGSYSWNEAIAAADLVRTLRALGEASQAEQIDTETSMRNSHYLRMRGRDGVKVPPEHE